MKKHTQINQHICHHTHSSYHTFMQGSMHFIMMDHAVHRWVSQYVRLVWVDYDESLYEHRFMNYPTQVFIDMAFFINCFENDAK